MASTSMIDARKTPAFQCLFCGEAIERGTHDPCALNLIAGADRQRSEQREQTFYCHINCLRERASIHPGNFYIVEPEFSTVGENEAES